MAEGLRYPGLDEHRAIEFLWATSDGTGIDSWHWLLETSATSFYIKSMNQARRCKEPRSRSTVPTIGIQERSTFGST
jgi:hypothetical protein